jgi:hypothetical protein
MGLRDVRKAFGQLLNLGFGQGAGTSDFDFDLESSWAGQPAAQARRVTAQVTGLFVQEYLKNRLLHGGVSVSGEAQSNLPP